MEISQNIATTYIKRHANATGLGEGSIDNHVLMARSMCFHLSAGDTPISRVSVAESGSWRVCGSNRTVVTLQVDTESLFRHA